jgi:hypothetical protein
MRYLIQLVAKKSGNENFPNVNLVLSICQLIVYLTIPIKYFFLFDTVRISEFSPMWTDFDKCDNLSKRNINIILLILRDLEPLRGSSNKKTLYSTRSSVNWTFFGTRGPLKRSFHSRFNLAHSYQKKPNLHTNSLNK